MGVLKAVAELVGDGPTPFPIVCGTSAGAINAVALAIYAHDFQRGVRRLVEVWEGFRVDDVYRSDFWGIPRAGARSLGAHAGLACEPGVAPRQHAVARAARANARLRAHPGERRQGGALRGRRDRLRLHLRPERHLLPGRQRPRGLAPHAARRRRDDDGRGPALGVERAPVHLPRGEVHREFFGDGSMRQMAPISPALHLGADRVLVIGSGRQAQDGQRTRSNLYPSLAQIAGHALNSIFLDSLAVDIERLQRINRTLDLLDADKARANGFPLRHVEVLVMSPSEPIERIAARPCAACRAPCASFCAASAG